MDPSLPQHQYSTRIRHNLTIKHDSINNPTITNHLPPFPPPGIVLHPEDATSKVFIPIARAFVSVDNRAMTIKDIAERAKAFGLQCQNLSAGAQAVTTYIRAHKARCDKEDDAPLLLSHTLSGTPADDDLVPALYSRAGGDSHPLPDRLTNFRKGTAVWYLGRATGVPCPFSRAGIRLCDYATTTTTGAQEGAEAVVAEGSRMVGLRKGLRNSNRDIEEGESCGQKRKRSLRGCMARADSSDNERPPKVKLTLRLKPLLARSAAASPNADADALAAASANGHVGPEGSSPVCPIGVSKEEDEEEEEEEDSDEEEDNEEDSMSVDSSDVYPQTTQKVEEEPWSLPPYPRRSISIPCYTPSVETFQPSYNNYYNNPYRRSPSVPYAYEATPPPDSDDEADDFHVAMARIKDYSEDEDEMGGWDADLDSEGEGETVGESPGPRSPSAPLLLPTEVAVKEEPRDVQGMLDAWEDFDTSVADARVADVLAKALELEFEGGADGQKKFRVKMEEPLLLDSDPWIWDAAVEDSTGAQMVGMAIKQEDDFDVHSLFPLSPPGPSSPLSSLSAQFAAFSTSTSTYSDSASPATFTLGGSESPRPEMGMRMGAELEEKWDRYGTVRPRAKTVPAPMPFFHHQKTMNAGSSSVPPPQSLTRSPSQDSAAAHAHPTNLARFYQPISVNTAAIISGASQLGEVGSRTGSGSGSSSLPPPTPCVSPLQTRCQPVSPPSPVVVTTCQPCKPAISATQIEDISVYQMMLGAFQLLRRIDTDFVNLSPILAFSGAALSNNTPPLLTSAIPNAIVITKGSPKVCGTWVPLSAAQAYVKEHLAEERARDLEVFLSDELVERFPEALREFHRNGRGKGLNLNLSLGLNQFGRHFASTIQAAKLEVQVEGGASASASVIQQRQQQQQQSGSGSTPVVHSGLTPLFVNGLGGAGVGSSRHVLEDDVPLSASEQQLFHELCVMPDEGLGDAEDGMDVDASSVDVPTSASAPAAAPAPRPPALDLNVNVERDVDVMVDVEEPMSPLSPLPPSPAMGASSMMVPTPMSPLFLSPPVLAQEPVPERGLDDAPHPEPAAAAVAASRGGASASDNGKPLRRSKRVADATQRQQAPPTTPSRSRARKNGSRNSLS
ncbi:hypothetical protein CVT25_006442 [Psilocybe cyanescens]|uniref:HTH APSES-type domain-containing protein n=1 Tax=Psilocybe cyanescens TaxID=93625 RepID=A0A409XE85_PSICY|nr:hypothetical protein CVT25_006442 [Psilocybe cyanescens]